MCRSRHCKNILNGQLKQTLTQVICYRQVQQAGTSVQQTVVIERDVQRKWKVTILFSWYLMSLPSVLTKLVTQKNASPTWSGDGFFLRWWLDVVGTMVQVTGEKLYMVGMKCWMFYNMLAGVLYEWYFVSFWWACVCRVRTPHPHPLKKDNTCMTHPSILIWFDVLGIVIYTSDQNVVRLKILKKIQVICRQQKLYCWPGAWCVIWRKIILAHHQA